MTIKIIIFLAFGLCGVLAGFVLGVYRMTYRASDGVCIRADDGEVYLKISEAGQQKLADPDTKLLYLRVVNVSTRNKHSL